jgi:penicillin-insensitive murein DD-endopeptidase
MDHRRDIMTILIKRGTTAIRSPSSRSISGLLISGLLIAGLTSITAQGRETGTQNPGLEQALGFYSRGSLIHANRMEDVGPGFLKLYLPRNRAFASSDLVKILKDAAAQLSSEYPSGERLQIGDISAENGGWISGHGSHQNGLDADLAYLRVNRHEQSPEATSGFQENFVQRGQVTANFDVARNFRIMQLLVNSRRINRIFVGATIKNRLCSYAQTSGQYEANIETLRRLRPLDHHDDHFHVRILCPAASPRCQAQEEVAPGSGCPGMLGDDGEPGPEDIE